MTTTSWRVLPALFNDVDPSQFHLVVGPRLRLGPTLNYIAPQYAGDYDAIGFLGDDHIPAARAGTTTRASGAGRWPGLRQRPVAGRKPGNGGYPICGHRSHPQPVLPTRTNTSLPRQLLDGFGTWPGQADLPTRRDPGTRALHRRQGRTGRAVSGSERAGHVQPRRRGIRALPENQLPDDIAAVQAVWA